MDIILFCFWADLAVMALLKLSAILLKCPTFKDGYFMFSWPKQVHFYVHCNVLTKELIKIKVRIVNFGFKVYFLG